MTHAEPQSATVRSEGAHLGGGLEAGRADLDLLPHGLQPTGTGAPRPNDDTDQAGERPRHGRARGCVARRPPRARALAGVIRVNQVGYAASAPQARLPAVARGRAPGRRSRSRTAAAPVFSGNAGADRGPWNGPYAHVCAMDFGGFTTPGTYTVQAAGATSPAVRHRHRREPVRAAARERARLLPGAARRRRCGGVGAAAEAVASPRRARVGLPRPALPGRDAPGRPHQGGWARWTWRAAGSTRATT